ncbi:uncharacterized protein LOC128858640 isoform X2 [Anastrepha ludens]|uniref:uncharacterized protein LOC128858640 isoform X2 n=1 Tax=Anastrepha ludens TaxID=28586 RepID=UPI0023AF875B|nr:uncharacterized protein LOC128858640 isoform X2 [Anastrepha ludens]
MYLIFIMQKLQAEVINAASAGCINKRLSPVATPQKYVSMFRIDGVPILPPLMTQEKRRQMEKFKERALKLEQRLEKTRRRGQNCNLEYGTMVQEMNQEPEAMDNTHQSSSSSSSASDHIIEVDVQREEVDTSYMLLSDLLIQSENEKKSIVPCRDLFKLNRPIPSADTDPDLEMLEPHSSESNLYQRMQKLQKSETLIYDHRSNTILTPLSEDEIQTFQQQQQQINLDHSEEKQIGCKVERNEIEESANLNYLTCQKSMGKCSDKALKKIPSICIDPPTPISSSRTFFDGINPQSSIDTINVNNYENSKKELNKSLIEELSSDESFNSMGLPKNLDRDLKTHRKLTNITSKILKFENFSASETKEDTPRCSNIRPPQRSATSPALKAATSERSQTTTVSLDVGHVPQNENCLVRSNSFTLDGPSKALIDHIRQQKVTPKDNYPTKRSNLFSMSATRDTVESKAKRVQKLDLKTRSIPTRLQLKPSTTNITSPSSLPFHSASNKNKRSPYEQKVIKPKISRQLKKSVSGTATIKQMKPRPSMPSIQSAKTATETAQDRTLGNQHFDGIETEHRQKFLDLLAHQRREQQRMQQVFEEQQRYLLEQLAAKMGTTHISQNIVGGSGNRSMDYSPIEKSVYVESPTLSSPTITANSSIVSNSVGTMDMMTGACEPTSLDLSACTSATPTTSQNSNRCTPRRRLFSCDISPSASICSNNISRSNGEMPGPSNSHQNAENIDAFEESNRREKAVTIINAHVRGYLVRRLLQTEHIQRIVQTIKDTLIFVWSLHRETLQDPIEANAPANIKLKAQLFKQLTSAIHTLHLILFQTSVTERMGIISRDRKRIKTKMLTMIMKRSPRIRS